MAGNANKEIIKLANQRSVGFSVIPSQRISTNKHAFTSAVVTSLLNHRTVYVLATVFENSLVHFGVSNRSSRHSTKKVPIDNLNDIFGLRSSNMSLDEDNPGDRWVLSPDQGPPRSNKIDIISDLSRYPHIVEKVFSYLPGTDLRVIPCISKKWNRVIKTVTPKANKRRKHNLKQLRSLRQSVGRVSY